MMATIITTRLGFGNNYDHAFKKHVCNEDLFYFPTMTSQNISYVKKKRPSYSLQGLCVYHTILGIKKRFSCFLISCKGDLYLIKPDSPAVFLLSLNSSHTRLPPYWRASNDAEVSLSHFPMNEYRSVPPGTQAPWLLADSCKASLPL